MDNMPMLQQSSDTDWRRYYEEKSRRQHKEIMDLKRQLAESRREAFEEAERILIFNSNGAGKTNLDAAVKALREAGKKGH